PPGLLEIVTLFNDTVADGSVTLKPTWFAFIVVFRTVVNEFKPVATPFASVFVAISIWSSRTGPPFGVPGAVPPRLSSAAAPPAPPALRPRDRARPGPLPPRPDIECVRVPTHRAGCRNPLPEVRGAGCRPRPRVRRFGNRDVGRPRGGVFRPRQQDRVTRRRT